MTTLVCAFRGQSLHAIDDNPEVCGDALASMIRLKRRGIQISLAMLSAALAAGLLSGVLPEMPYKVILQTVSVIWPGLALYLGSLFLQNSGQVHCVWHSGRLHFETGVPPCWVSSTMTPQLQDDAIVVRAACSISFRHGAYAAMGMTIHSSQ